MGVESFRQRDVRSPSLPRIDSFFLVETTIHSRLAASSQYCLSPGCPPSPAAKLPVLAYCEMGVGA